MSMITPGPWEQNGEAVDAENNSVLNIAVCNMARVAHGWSGTDYTTQKHQIANARLIAAAPDLLAVLTKIRGYHVNHHVLHEIDAAITKATGEASQDDDVEVSL